MARFPVPSEARLEALLREAYEFMPGPDMNRLGEIETRLLRAVRRPARPGRAALPWWAILLLAGGAATAAWWAGERFIGGESVRDTDTTVAEPDRARSAAPGGKEHGREAPAPDGVKDRILYEREAP